MDRDEVEVHKNVKRELGQYPAILTELAWSIIYILRSPYPSPRVCKDEGRSYGDIVTKFSWLDGLLIFLTHGASLARFARWSSANIDHFCLLLVSLQRDPQDPFKINEIILDVCTSENLPLWLALIYVYKGIMLLYGVFLAYETRNVVYPHLNDSRVIGICVYNVVVLSMIGAFLSVILEDKQFKELYASLSLCIIFPASATISLIFIPKVRATSQNVFCVKDKNWVNQLMAFGLEVLSHFSSSNLPISRKRAHAQ